MNRKYRSVIFSAIIAVMVPMLSSCPQPVLIAPIEQQYLSINNFPSDPSGEWLFSGNLKDTSGNGNDITRVIDPIESNDMDFTADRSGTTDHAWAVNIPSTTGSMSATYTDNSTGSTSEFSLSFWLYPAWSGAASPNIPLVYTTFPLSGEKEFYLELTNGDTLTVRNLSSATVSFPANLSMHEWHNVVITWDAASAAVNAYLDGISLGSKSLVFDDPASSMTRIFFPGNSYEGGYDDIRIYTRDLTADEIYALYYE